MICARQLLGWFALVLSGVSPGQCATLDRPAKPVWMRGRIVAMPECFSGRWETSIGPGKAVGIWLLLDTRINGAATTLNHVDQYEENFTVSIFERDGHHLEFDNGSFPNEPGGGLQWDGRHIRARRGWRSNDPTNAALDLTYDPAEQTWYGFLRRGGFAKIVTLRRAANTPVKARSELAGTWKSEDRLSLGCFHVAEQADGRLAGWSDELQTPGAFRYANGLKPPTSSVERYGNLLNVLDLGKHRYSVEFGAYGGICCSSTLIAKVAGEDLLVGDWQAGPNQEARRSVWKRMSHGTCRGRE